MLIEVVVSIFTHSNTAKRIRTSAYIFVPFHCGNILNNDDGLNKLAVKNRYKIASLERAAATNDQSVILMDIHLGLRRSSTRSPPQW